MAEPTVGAAGTHKVCTQANTDAVKGVVLQSSTKLHPQEGARNHKPARTQVVCTARTCLTSSMKCKQ